MEISNDENIKDSIINNIDTNTLIYIAKELKIFNVSTIEDATDSLTKKQIEDRNELSMLFFGMEYNKLFILTRIICNYGPDNAKQILKGAEKINAIHKNLVNSFEKNVRKRKNIDEEEEQEKLPLTKNVKPLKKIDLTLNTDDSNKDEEDFEIDEETETEEEKEEEEEEMFQPVTKKRILPNRKAKVITCKRKRKSSQRTLTPVDMEKVYQRWKQFHNSGDVFDMQKKPKYVSTYALYSYYVRMLYKELRNIEKKGNLTVTIMKEKIDEISKKVSKASQKDKEMDWETFLGVMLHDLGNDSSFMEGVDYDDIRDYFIDVLVGKYPHYIQPIPEDLELAM